MDRKSSIKCSAGLVLLALACSGIVSAADADHVYTTGFNLAAKLGGDLHEVLPKQFFDQIDGQAVTLKPLDLPWVAPITVTAGKDVQRQVQISAGFLDLANHLCHAKAIDKVRQGYFDQYVDSLARAYATNLEAAMPAIVEPLYWTDDILNDQTSYFNSMTGMIISINMSHHYLGHYAKYAAKLAGSGNKMQSINSLLTPAEWDNAVKAGALDGLNLALSTEGLRALFTALDKLPARPSWAASIAPQNVDFKKLNAELAQFEDDFFHGRIKN